MTDAQWQDVIDVNLTGVANTLRAAIPHLKARNGGGRIVTLSSVGSEGGVATVPS
jgi:NAD(P)-dependent dehydrogenase (short-subunit alcohol dehydrogenase family)